jgi:hypothetical protein
MAVDDWADYSRWFIKKDSDGWFLAAPGDDWDTATGIYPSFAEAHAAYLDAVTCDAQTPFPAYSEPRCTRVRGHKGGHKFPGRDGLTILEQMPK